MASDVLEFNEAAQEVVGAMLKGKLKLRPEGIQFKQHRSGKVSDISTADIELVNWQRLGGGYGIRVFTSEGKLHRFGGLKEGDYDRISKFIEHNLNKHVKEKDFSVKGWNWGTAQFNGSVLSFDVGGKPAFEIPLNNVSKSNTGKNEVTLEFHHSDDGPSTLMEMRFHIPPGEGDTEPVEAFYEQVMKKASVITSMGDAIAIFREIPCLTPRGRYDIKIFTSFVQLHGKTFDFKIAMKTVMRLFLLPHRDQRQMFFVLSLDPPIKQGQTRYHYLILLFPLEDKISIDIPLSEEELAEKYDGRLDKELSGPTYEVLSKIMKAMVNKRITVPGSFLGHSGTPAIACSYKAAAGYLYPLEKGLIYVHKPPLHVRFEEVTSVNFARSGGSTRSFDFEVELKTGVVHTFSSIEKEEHPKLQDFVTEKKLHVKNRGVISGGSMPYDMAGSDVEDERDAYLERVKAEGRERDDVDNESEDEDFNPGEEQSDVAEEYDSNVTSSDSDLDGSDAERKRRKKQIYVPPKRDKPRQRKPKQAKDVNRPKRPATAYMLWFNTNRDKIRLAHGNLSLTEMSKKAGELWRGMSVEEKRYYEAQAAERKREYDEAMRIYKESGAEADFLARKAAGTLTTQIAAPAVPTIAMAVPVAGGIPTVVTTSKPGSGTAFKSKEYISDDDSTDEDIDDDDDDDDDNEQKAAGDNRAEGSDDDDDDDELQLPDSDEEELSGASESD